MADSSLTSFLFIVLLVPFAVIAISYLPGSEGFDVRWVTMTANLIIAVCAVYASLWCYSIERSLKLLNKLLIDRDGLLRPELKGIVELLRQRLREIWKWGAPNN